MEHFKLVFVFSGRLKYRQIINLVRLSVSLLSDKLCTILLAVLFWSAIIQCAKSQLVVNDPQFRYVDQFGSVRLDCSTPDNSPVACRVGWLRGAGSRVQNDSHYTIHCNGSLEIRNVTESLVGVENPYRCYDNRGVFEDSRSIFIELKSWFVCMYIVMM